MLILCQECNYQTDRESNLKRHMEMKHNSNKKFFYCDVSNLLQSIIYFAIETQFAAQHMKPKMSSLNLQMSSCHLQMSSLNLQMSSWPNQLSSSVMIVVLSFLRKVTWIATNDLHVVKGWTIVLNVHGAIRCSHPDRARHDIFANVPMWHPTQKLQDPHKTLVRNKMHPPSITIQIVIIPIYMTTILL